MRKRPVHNLPSDLRNRLVEVCVKDYALSISSDQGFPQSIALKGFKGFSNFDDEDLISAFYDAILDEVHEALGADLGRWRAEIAGWEVRADPDQSGMFYTIDPHGNRSDISYEGETEAWAAAVDDMADYADVDAENNQVGGPSPAAN